MPVPVDYTYDKWHERKVTPWGSLLPCPKMLTSNPNHLHSILEKGKWDLRIISTQEIHINTRSEVQVC